MPASSAPIVCGVDDSTGGREALTVAEALCERLVAPLVAVHAEASAPAMRYDDPHQRDRLEQSSIRRAERLLSEIAGRGSPNLDVAQRAELGPPAERLAAIAFSDHAEMIVVGSRGRGPLASALLGSTSRELIAIAPCPVLVVPPGATALPRSRRVATRGPRPSVLCGVDGSPESAYAAEAAWQLAQRMDNRLVLVYSYAPATTYGEDGQNHHFAAGPLLSQWRAGLRHLDTAAAALPGGPEPELALEPGDPSVELIRVAAREGAEVLVVGSHGQGKLEAAVFGSVAASLAAAAPVPVLVVPPGTGMTRPEHAPEAVAAQGSTSPRRIA
jgi:nucleotide-binding universal stress UspA family protein